MIIIIFASGKKVIGINIAKLSYMGPYFSIAGEI